MNYLNDEHYRRSGRSTIIVDKCIQELFNKGYTRIIDHHYSEQANKYAFDIFMRRISLEHKYIIKTLTIIKDKYFVALDEKFVVELHKMIDYDRREMARQQ